MATITLTSVKDPLQFALDGRLVGLNLPAGVCRSVITDFEPDAAHHTGREPGFTTGSPLAQRGHKSGCQV